MRPLEFSDRKNLTLANWITVIRRDGLPFIVVASTVFTTVFLMWASNRGFDITDEGFYLLSSQYPEEMKLFVSSAHSYTYFLYQISHQNVIGLRILGFISNLACATVFYFGFYRLTVGLGTEIGQTILEKFSTASFILLGAMLGYSFFPVTPYYNVLNSIALTACSGSISFALAGLNIQNAWGWSKRIAFFMAGLFIGIAFFVKFPTGISLLILFGLVIFLWPGQDLKIRLRSLGFIVLGLGVWLFFHFNFIQSATAWWRGLQGGIEMALKLEAGYGANTLGRYYNECILLAKNAVSDYWRLHVILLFGFSALFGLRKVWRELSHWPTILLLAVLGYAAFLSYRRGFCTGAMSSINLTRLYLSWLILLGVAFIATLFYCQLVKSYVTRRNILEVIFWGAILFFLPFAGAAGTGNYIFVIMVWCMAPWFGLLLALLVLLSKLLRTRWILWVGITIISSFACAQIISGCLLRPYRLNTGLAGQTEPTRIGYPETILKLDPPTSDFFNKVRRLASAHGFKPGDDVLGFFDMPGVVFALGGRSPVNPWYPGCGYKGARAFAEKALSLVPSERLKRAFILETSGSAVCMPDLAKFGINFPGDYILCGELMIPYPWTKETVRFWKPRFL